ncbi:hypothetical protein AB0K00_54870 [Dactylosporangium sp. NPDC049525]|uniref:hypothetical protein n=1 Tax=Dactylosporangium sp. NPDC049525 TaxID=3154730 RepID=UPI003440251F
MDGRFPRHAMVLSLLVSAAAAVLAVALGALMVSQWYSRSDRADTEVVGRPSPISSIGSDGWTSYVSAVEVVWTDADDEVHIVRFDVPDGSDWSSREEFRLRYDPANPDVDAFPAGDDARLVTGVHPPWWGLFLVLPFLLFAGAAAAAWRVRVRRAHAAAAGPPSRWRVVPLVWTGTVGATGGSVNIGVATMLVPADADPPEPGIGPVVPPPGALWQPVMWSREVADLRAGDEVTARISEGRAGRAVIDTDGGHRIWPSGRLRAGAYLPRHRTGAIRHASATWPRPSGWYLFAPVPGILFGMILPSAWFTVPLVVAFFYCLVFTVWAWRGGVPHDL